MSLPDDLVERWGDIIDSIEDKQRLAFVVGKVRNGQLFEITDPFTLLARYDLNHGYGIPYRDTENYIAPREYLNKSPIWPLDVQSFLSRVPPASVYSWTNVLRYISTKDLYRMTRLIMPTENPLVFLKRYIVSDGTLFENTDVDMISDDTIELDITKEPPAKKMAIDIPTTFTHGLQCPNCSVVPFSSHVAYTRHMDRHKRHKVFLCSPCSREFHTQRELDNHTKRHRFSCEFCPLKFLTEEEAIKHTESVHLSHPGLPGTTALEQLPIELIWEFIIPLLEMEDMAQLQGVSKTVKDIVDGQIGYRNAFLHPKALMKTNPPMPIISYYFKKRGKSAKFSDIKHVIKDGKLSELQWICKISPDTARDIQLHIMKVLRICCEFDYFKMAVWVCEYFHFAVPEEPTREMYKISSECMRCRLEMVEFIFKLFSLTEDTVRNNMQEYLEVCCSSGNIIVLRWFCTQFKILTEDFNPSHNMSIALSCSNGYVEVVRYLFQNFFLGIEDVRAHNSYSIRFACMNGYIDVVRYLCERFELDVADIMGSDNRTLVNVCENGKFEILEYLCGRFDFTVEDVRRHDNLALKKSCENGHFRIVELLCTHFPLELEDIKTGMYYSIRMSCENGHLDVVRWLTLKYLFTKEDFKVWGRRSFITSCERGHIEMLQWLYTTYYNKQEYNFDFKDGFISSCRAGQLEIAKWICKTFSLKVKTVTFGYKKPVVFEALRESCDSGNLLVADWLFTRFELNNENVYELLRRACVQNQVKVVEWLFLKFDINESEYTNLFSECCRNGSFECAKWISKHFHFTIDDIRRDSNRALREACIHGRPVIVEWLCRTFPLTIEDVGHKTCVKAVYNSRTNVIEYLIRHFSITPDDIGSWGDHATVCRLLRTRTGEWICNHYDMSKYD